MLLNPGPDDPPHLLVVEHIDLSDPDEPYVCYLVCPFAETTFEYYSEHRQPQVVTHFDSNRGKRGQSTELAVRRRVTMHVEPHYCTLPRDSTHMPPPVMTFYVRWRDPASPRDKAPETCARIEVNPRQSVNYGCYYQEVVSQNGLIDALVGWRAAAKLHQPDTDPVVLPPGLPDVVGEYPIYYWSEGHGEGFEDGFMFEHPDRIEPIGDVLARSTATSPV